MPDWSGGDPTMRLVEPAADRTDRALRAGVLAALVAGWLLTLWPATLPPGDVTRTAVLLVRAAMLLTLPGLAVLLVLRPLAGADALQTLCLAPLLSLALFPVLLLWAGVLGAAWSRVGILWLLITASVAVLWRLRRPLAAPNRGTALALAGAGGAFVLALAVRLWIIRGVPYPSWVDSYHHTLITQKIMETGRVPSDYHPYAPLASFHYHFGYHAWSAFLAWLTGLPAHRAVLWGGQVLNALTVPSLYVLVDRLAHDRRAAFLAATIAGLVCWLPAYYVNWGRYPQLAGHLLLPAGVIFAWETARGPRGPWRPALAGGVVAAGIGLTHYRVAVFYIAAAAIVVIAATVSRHHAAQEEATSSACTNCDREPLADSRWPAAPGHTLSRLLLLGVIALVLVAPWLPSVLAKSAESAQVVSARGGGQTDYFTLDFVLIMGLPRFFLGVSIAAGMWMLARARQCPLGALILAWLGLVVALANPEVSGIPAGFLENGSVIVALYLPACLLLGLAISDAAGLLKRRVRIPRLADGVVALGLIAAAVSGMGDMLAWGFEPGRVFVTNSDLAALNWIRDHTPAEARFAVASNFWLPEGLEGVDAGLWIPYATGRQTTVPPMIYINEAPQDQIAAINALAQRMNDAASPGELASLLRANGVEYVYRGLREPPPWYVHLDAPQVFERIYDAEGVAIYRLR